MTRVQIQAISDRYTGVRGLILFTTGSLFYLSLSGVTNKRYKNPRKVAERGLTM